MKYSALYLNNVNPYGIYIICVEINIVLHSRIIFSGKRKT